MFILTKKGRLINTRNITWISRSHCAITALMFGDEAATLLAAYDSEDECELAFDTLIETLKARKELYTFGG